jgi:hypothetical protein
MRMKRLLVLGAAVIAAAAAASAPDHASNRGSSPPTVASIKTCGRVADTHYSFRVIAHGNRAPSCGRARQMARRAVGGQIDHPLPVLGWSCMADYFYDGPWSFLCIRKGSHGQVSIDRFLRTEPFRTLCPPAANRGYLSAGDRACRRDSSAA